MSEGVQNPSEYDGELQQVHLEATDEPYQVLASDEESEMLKQR